MSVHKHHIGEPCELCCRIGLMIGTFVTLLVLMFAIGRMIAKLDNRVLVLEQHVHLLEGRK